MKSETFVDSVGAFFKFVGAVITVSAVVSCITGVVIGPLLALWPWETDPYRVFSVTAVDHAREKWTG